MSYTTLRFSRFPISALVAIGLVGMSTAPALGATLDPTRAREIQRTVNRYAYFTVFDDVRVGFDDVDAGVITLEGSVTNPRKKTDIERRVAAVDGITGVRNFIEVLPVSSFDDELRYRVARAIYGNAAFWHYAARQDPSIHIVVNRGHVTLTGTADSNSDRALASVLAAQFGAFSVTNELRLPGPAVDQTDQSGRGQ